MSTDVTQGNSAEREAEVLEDRLDSALAKLARVEQANDETVPSEVVQRLSDGAVPIAVWREYRGLSLLELAEASHVPFDVVEAVERGKEDIPLRMMQAIAQALRVDLDDLVPWSQDDPA